MVLAATQVAYAPNVLSASQFIPAGNCSTMVDFIEVSSGITCEIGAGSYLEVT